MAHVTSRRSFLASGAACAGAAWLAGCGHTPVAPADHGSLPRSTKLRAEMRSLDINGKAANVMGLAQTNGKQGLSFTVNQPFNVLLENKLSVPTAIHWHGLHPPNNQDGVPGLTQPVIAPNTNYQYNFPVRPSGTHWMHSHEGLQEAFLLSAPLIVHDPSDKAAEQEIILFLGDFSFTSPTEIFAKLRKPAAGGMKMGGAMKMGGGKMGGGISAMGKGKPDTSDVDYDAYLANDRTLSDPEVVQVEKNGRVRLRIINGSSGTNFFVSVGDLSGELIATDGMPVDPIRGSLFPLAIAQRIDLILQLPGEGAFPILALRENAMEQAGIILATPGASVKKIPLKGAAPAGILNLDLERQLVAAEPLAARPIDHSYDLRLAGQYGSV